MVFLRKLESFIIDGQIGVQTLVNVIEWFFKIKYYTKAKVWLVLTAAYLVSSDYVSTLEAAQKGVIIIPGSLIVVSVLVFWVIQLIKVAKPNTDKGFRNPLREMGSYVILRSIFLLFVILDSVDLVFGLGTNSHLIPFDVGVSMILYVLACDEAPPMTKVSPALT